MSKEFIKEAKNFKLQAKWCAIMCWIATALFIYKKPEAFSDWVIVTFGAIVFTIIYVNMRDKIKKYEDKQPPTL